MNVVSMLILETSASGVAGFLRAHAHIVKLSLFGSHVAIITIECAHCSLSATVQGCLRICNCNTSFLGSSQLLDEAVG